MRRHSRSNHQLRVVDSPFINKRREEFKRAIRDSFKDSNFSKLVTHTDFGERTSRFDVDSVLRSISGRGQHGRRSVVALDEAGDIVGAVFHVPTKKERADENANYGWFFTTPHQSLRRRVDIANDMIEHAHDIMREAGYKKVRVNMGTDEGARFLRKRHKYKKVPGSENTWERDLTE
jgi:hypothetical protein